MNAIRNILALACAFSFLTACVEENFEKHSSKDGDKIVFKAAAGYMSDGPETRTVYSGNRYTVPVPGQQTLRRHTVSETVLP